MAGIPNGLVNFIGQVSVTGYVIDTYSIQCQHIHFLLVIYVRNMYCYPQICLWGSLMCIKDYLEQFRRDYK